MVMTNLLGQYCFVKRWSLEKAQEVIIFQGEICALFVVGDKTYLTIKSSNDKALQNFDFTGINNTFSLG